MTASLKAEGPRTLIFDFGGVVFHWRPAALLARVLPQHIADADAAARWQASFFQGQGGDWWAFDAGLIGVDQLCQRISQRTGLQPQEVQAVVEAGPGELQAIADTVALIQALRAQGHRLLFLSNMPLPFVQHLRQHQPVLQAFEDGVFSSEVRCAKPDPAIFHLACRQFGLTPAEAWFIDDHPANIEVAQSLGFHCWHFTGAAALGQALRRLGLLPPAG
jgi:putative hydrolase of the HAD superfamily